MTDLYIHIGAPKTGTTAIQQYFLKNRRRLADQGLLYPAGGLIKAGHHTIGGAIFPGRTIIGDAAFLDNTGVSRDKALQASIEGIYKEIEERKPHTVILSTEYLWGELSASNVQRLLQPFSGFSITIVAYLRRQDLLSQSLYVQAVKGGLTEPFAVWLDRVVDSQRAGFDFHKVLSCWKNSGVAANILAGVYEKPQLRGDICSDFLAMICPQIAVPRPSTHQVVNSSPDEITVELLRLVSRKIRNKITDPHLRSAIRRQILKHSPSRALFAPLNYLSAEEANALVARFADQNAMVARDFLNRPDGKLFHDALPTSDPVPTADPAPELILERLVDLLPALLEGKEEQLIAGTTSNVTAKRAERPATRPPSVGARPDMASL